MSEQSISAEKITKPFQLLAAWLISLSTTNTGFLFAAANVNEPSWGAGALIIASIVNVPIHIFALFQLQTKFRPQLQDDEYFSRYIALERAMKDQNYKVITVDDSASEAEKLKTVVSGIAKKNQAVES